jgi:hypothetical protein
MWKGGTNTSTGHKLPAQIFLIITLVFLSHSACFAEQVPVGLKADDLRYDDENKIILASGNVRVTYEDMEIRADRLEMNTETNSVTADGAITVSRNGAESKGATLFLDIKSKNLRLSDFSLDYHTDRIAGKVYMYARELNTSGNEYFGHDGGFTTCSLHQPHYWLSAKEFRYYPDEKIEGFHVCYNFSFMPLPVFYTPYYQFLLGKRKMILLMPVIGQNNVEGFFVRTETMYFVDETTEGSIYIDHLDKKGIGRGFKYNYQIKGAPGSFYLYNVNEKMASDEVSGDYLEGVTQNFITKFRQTLYLTDQLQMDLAHNYTKTYLIPSGRKDATDHDIGLTFKDDFRNAKFQNRFNLDYQTGVESVYYGMENAQEGMSSKLTADKAYNPSVRARTDTMLLTHHQDLVERWTFDMNPRFYQQRIGDQYPDQRLDIPLTLTNTGKDTDLYKKLTIEYLTYVDPDGSRVTADDHVEYVNKLPLTTLQLQTLDLDIFAVDTELGVGIIEESKFLNTTSRNNRVLRVTRYTEQLTLFRDLEFPLGNTLTLKRYMRQVSYDIPGKHYRISDQPAFKTRLWDHLEHDFTYIYTTAAGESPIFYEAPQYDHENRLRETLRLYHEDMISWKLSGGTNYEIMQSNLDNDTDIDPRDDLMTELDCRPFGKYLSVNFNTGWSYQQELWRDYVTAVNLQPNREDSWTIKTVYDNNVAQFKSANSLLKFHLGKTWWEEDEWEFWTSRWAFSIEHVYDYYSDIIDLYTLGIYKDLHCWSMQFNYTKAREEWILAFSLMAFPDEPVSMTSNRDGFSIEAFRKSLENPGVSRY